MNMRSRSNSLEDATKAKPGHRADANKRSAERGEPSGRAEQRTRHREPPDDTGTIQRNHKTAKNSTSAGGSGNGSGSASGAPKAGRREKGRDLSRDDLVFLLSLLEGELQVIKSAEESWIHVRELKLSHALQLGCRCGTGPSRTENQTQ